ncbi:MAG TPA: hypothetical protein VN213_03780, partial [Solirubrobacteraceae bacterium]|nr:hypothetical protein [Solirubrobacteraceae bacterium]
MSGRCLSRRRSLALPVAGVLLVAVSGCGDDGSSRTADRAATPTATSTPAAGPAGGTPPRREAGSAVAWTRAEVLARLHGRTLRVEGRAVRLDRETITCAGLGAERERRRGASAWTRFRCIQPTFPPGGVAGPDAIVIVRPTGARTFAVTARR